MISGRFYLAYKMHYDRSTPSPGHLDNRLLAALPAKTFAAIEMAFSNMSLTQGAHWLPIEFGLAGGSMAFDISAPTKRESGAS
jgi:hypothetical protein